MENIFDAKVAQQYIARLNNLEATAERKWGKMSVGQMLAHLNVTYETIYEPGKHPKTGRIARWMLKNFVKPKVVSETPYKQNLPTGPIFIIKDEPNFEEEKKRLIGFIQKTQQLGAEAFQGKENVSFGALTSSEWNNLMAKHLNHHFAQFSI